MTSTVDALAVLQRVPPLDAATERRLLALPSSFARAIEDETDVPNLIGEARHLARSRPLGDPLGAILEARAAVLERTDRLFFRAVEGVAKTRARLDTIHRGAAARYGPVLAAHVHPRGSTDERALSEAAAWLGTLDAASASRAIQIMRRERALLEADELRCRAYHDLRGFVARAQEEGASTGGAPEREAG